MKRVTVILTPADRFLIGFLLTASIFSFGLLGLTGKREPGAVVEIRGSHDWREKWRLTGIHVIKVPGPLGETSVEIKDGTIRVLSSPCPMKICMKMGKKSHAGEIIVCTPNQVIVIIEGQKKELDGISY